MKKINISNIDADLKEMAENSSKKKLIVQNNEFNNTTNLSSSKIKKLLRKV